MKATIDRIEGKTAVLIPCKGEQERLTVPLSLLPAGCREGDIVTIGIERDPDATVTAKERVAGLIEKLKKQ